MFDVLQDDADHCDSDLNTIMQSQNHRGAGATHLTCIGSWVLYHTLRVRLED